MRPVGRALAWLLAGLLAGLLAAAAQAQAQAPDQTEAARLQARQLLEWSGALALLEQAPRVAEIALRTQPDGQPDPAREEAWRRRLAPERLQRELIDYFVSHYDAAAFATSAEQLQQPLAKRVRFFELAMSQVGTLRGLREALAQPLAADPTRLALVREIDAALGESQRVALLQTLVAQAVQPADGRTAESPLDEAVALRQRHLAPLTEQYLLHAYRYLKTEELQAYRDLWQQPQLQWLQQLTLQGMEAVFDGSGSQP